MMLDLYITHWTEPWEIGQKAFQMLGLQRCVDWNQVRVTLVHDGSRAFPAEYFVGLPFAMRQVQLPHGGIAAARNWCIDDSGADWIKWCDFDDMFASAYSLKNIMDALEQDPPMDLLWFNIYAEDPKRKNVFLRDERDGVFLHNKVIRRSFLKEHGIRFNPILTWCEDSAMLAVVEMEIDHQRIGRINCETPIYAYIQRDGSLCNRDEIKMDNLISFFLRHTYVQEEFRKHGQMDAYYTMTARVLADSYYTLELSGVRGKFPDEQVRKHEETVLAYYREHRTDLLRIGSGMFDDVIRAVNLENENCHITKDQLIAWLRKLNEEQGRDADV